MTKTNRKPASSRARKIEYWIATLWIALGMVATGVMQLSYGQNGQGGLDMITHLCYAAYLLSLLGTWKILGVIAVLIPKFPLVEEWAYAGFFFVMTGAIFSHIAVGDSLDKIFPALILLILAAISLYYRPDSRRIISIRP